MVKTRFRIWLWNWCNSLSHLSAKLIGLLEVGFVIKGGQRRVIVHAFLVRRDQVDEDNGGDGMKSVSLTGLQWNWFESQGGKWKRNHVMKMC